jgi:hypothetical protein
MRPSLALAALTLLGSLLCQHALSPCASADPPPPKKPPSKVVLDKSAGACTQVTGTAVSAAFAFKHVVSLRNGCDKPVECEVWTDVDPSPRQVLRAEQGESVEVITRVGSPAREFKAFKECRFR